MEKYHKTDIAPIEKENERDENYQATNPQIDSSRTADNYHIIQREQSYTEFINERIDRLHLPTKPRKDAVLMTSFVLGSDNEFFNGMSSQEQYLFFLDCVRFFSERYGRENIISAVVHTDETTPHLHLNLIPVKDGKLCAKDLFNRKALTQLQTEFYEKVGKKWGLQRGKEESTAKHLNTAEFKAKKIIEGAEQQAQEYLDGVHEEVEAAQNQPLPKKKKEVAEEVTSLRKDNAAYKQQLEIKNRDSKGLFNLVQEQERKLRTSEKAYKMVTDIIETYPDEFEALLSKARQKKNPPAYFNGNRKGSGNTK